MIDGSKKDLLLTKKVSLEKLRKEKSTVSKPDIKIYESNLNTNSDNYEWIFDIYIPNLIDLVEEHKKLVKKNSMTDRKLDKVLILQFFIFIFNNIYVISY